MATIVTRRWVYNGETREAYRVSYTDRSGKRRFKQFDKRKDAAEFAKTCEGAETNPRGGITILEAARMWLDACEKGLGEHLPVEYSTMVQYNGMVLSYISPRIGHKRLTEITSGIVKKFRDDLIKDGVSRNTARKVLQSLRGILSEAKDRGLIIDNPALGIKVVMSTRDKEPVTIPSMTEMRTILAKADELAFQTDKKFAKIWRRYRMMVMVTALTGLRASELRGLPWSNVDLKAGTIKVSQRADIKGTIGSPKSRAGTREIQIPAMLTKLLQEWRVECVPGVHKLVFPNWSGNVEALTNLHKRGWYLLLERAGVVDEKGAGKYTWHSLRHFRASVLIDSGATAKEIMVEMGHSSIKLTYDTYGHLFPEGKEKRKQRAEDIAGKLIPARSDTRAIHDTANVLIEGPK